MHRRHADEIREAFRQDRTRLPDLLGQFLDRPVLGRPCMHQRQRLADEGSRRPASQPACSGGNVCKYRRTTSMNISSLSLARTLSPPARFSADSMAAKRMNWPSQLASPVLRIAGLDHARQVLEQRIERLGIAGEIAAHEIGRGRAVAAVAQGERQSTRGRGIERGGLDRLGAHAGAARHDMGIAMGKHDHLAGFERDRLPAVMAPKQRPLVTT